MEAPGLALRVVDALEAAAVAHTSGRFLEVFEDDELEQAIFADASDHREQLTIALEFLLGWADCAAHDFRYYPGFAKDEWPRLATQVADDIRSTRAIGDPRILAAFGPRQPAVGIFAGARRFLGI
jgi:hypothetical protein